MQIYKRRVHQRRSSFFQHPVIQLAVDFKAQRLVAVATFGFDPYRKKFFAELPLHEGRGDRIHRSGGVDLFAGAEGQAVWCARCRHRVSPLDLA